MRHFARWTLVGYTLGVILTWASGCMSPILEELPPCPYYTRPSLILSGTHTPAVWHAILEVQRVTGLYHQWVEGDGNLTFSLGDTKGMAGLTYNSVTPTGCRIVRSRIVFQSPFQDHEGVALHETLHALGLEHDEIGLHPEKEGAHLTQGEELLLRRRYGH